MPPSLARAVPLQPTASYSPSASRSAGPPPPNSASLFSPARQASWAKFSDDHSGPIFSLDSHSTCVTMRPLSWGALKVWASLQPFF